MSLYDLAGESFNPNQVEECEMGGDFQPIPAGAYFATVESCEWHEFEQTQDRVISLKWRILGGDYDKRIVFQKLKVEDTDTKKRVKAVKMLLTLNAFAGNRMPLNRDPDDSDLMLLCGLQCWLQVMVYDYQGKQGNWVNKVAKKAITESPAPKFENDIPF